jgi:uncharacterized protein YbjT (DUF2867 family)
MDSPVWMNTNTRRVVLAGATGLVGGHVLAGLLADEAVAEVHVVGRRPVSVSHAKLRMHVVDLRAIPPLPTADEVYLALGTTIKVAGSREAFRAVDYDANLAVARAAYDAGARRIGLVSAMGANAKSSVFYSRVKGELEDAVLRLETSATVVVRPSLLVGDRRRLGQPARRGETLAAPIMDFLRVILPRNYRAISAEKVARALLAEVPTAKGARVIASGDLQAY